MEGGRRGRKRDGKINALCYLSAEGTNTAPSSPTQPGCLGEGNSGGARHQEEIPRKREGCGVGEPGTITVPGVLTDRH